MIDSRMNRQTVCHTRRTGAALRARPFWIFLLALFPGAAVASDVTVAIDPTPHSCGVQGRFHAGVPAALAWEVLTDYDHIPRFVRSMISSRSERTADGRMQVRQTASARVFVFRRRMNVLLEIEEDPVRRIGFRDVLGQDFTRYAGEWRIDRDSTGTSVRYALEAEPRGAFGRSMCRGLLQHAAKDLLEQVCDEMLRRAAGTNSPGMPKP